jgi:hypothetical protein
MALVCAAPSIGAYPYRSVIIRVARSDLKPICLSLELPLLLRAREEEAMIELNFPPMRRDGEVFAPAGCARRDYPGLTEEEFEAEVCRVFTERQVR